MSEKIEIEIASGLRAVLYRMTLEEATGIDDAFCRKYYPERFERAKRFRFEADRLRSIGAAYLLYDKLGLAEEDLIYGLNGKPKSDRIGSCFNISHAGEYIVLAVSEREIGVDIEAAQSLRRGRSLSEKEAIKSCLSIAKYCFTEEEQEWMKLADAGEGMESRFMNLWTMKESVIKATGKGLRLSLQSFDVLPLLQKSGELNTICLEDRELCGHSISYPGYCLSLALEI